MGPGFFAFANFETYKPFWLIVPDNTTLEPVTGEYWIPLPPVPKVQAALLVLIVKLMPLAEKVYWVGELLLLPRQPIGLY
jgi:hypothetical protein